MRELNQEQQAVVDAIYEINKDVKFFQMRNAEDTANIIAWVYHINEVSRVITYIEPDGVLFEVAANLGTVDKLRVSAEESIAKYRRHIRRINFA